MKDDAASFLAATFLARFILLLALGVLAILTYCVYAAAAARTPARTRCAADGLHSREHINC
ncbi:hypothetical protein KCP78_12875 [Salmonella enterica subsp. enterica]|nr:hypothetical protein KCP78_12875 [Salmonella enterica subsp. enterica]